MFHQVPVLELQLAQSATGGLFFPEFDVACGDVLALVVELIGPPDKTFSCPVSVILILINSLYHAR